MTTHFLRSACLAFFVFSSLPRTHAQTPDAGLTEVVPPPQPFTAGIHPVRIRLTNHDASIPISYARVSWTVNGTAQPPVSWLLHLPPGQDTLLVLGGVQFTLGNAYTIEARVVEVNALGPDPMPDNDQNSLSGIGPAYTGVIRVGGAGANFNTLSAMAAALDMFGVADDVNVYIAPGEYDELLAFAKIPYCAATRTLTFQPDPALPGEVVLSNGSSPSPYTWTFNLNHGFIHLKNLNFRATATLFIRSLDANITSTLPEPIGFTLDSCRFEGTAMAAGPFAIRLETVNGTGALQVQHCTVNGLAGGATLRLKNGEILVRDNRVQDAGLPTFILTNCTGEIRQNRFDPGQSAASPVPLSLTATNGQIAFMQNRVSGAGTRTAVFQHGIGSSGAYFLHIDNNYFQHTNKNAPATAANVEVGGDNVSFRFNTLRSAAADVLLAKSWYGGVLGNTILANAGTGLALRVEGSFTAAADYNDYYAASGKLMRRNNQTYTALSAWQSAFSQDAHSLSANPKFYGPLEPSLAQPLLDGGGIPVPGLESDLDAQPRDPQHPDIGALEFAAFPTDAALLAITAPAFPFAAGQHTIRATLLNDGSQPLTQLDFAVWINGVSVPALPWTGLLPPGESISVPVADYVFADLTPYAIAVYPIAVNNAPESYRTNDTARVSNLFTALRGNYPVNQPAALFPTLKNAVEALKKYGVAGAVTFDLAPGDYSGALRIDSFPRDTGVIYPVTFRAPFQGAVQYTVTADTGIYLDRADGLAFKNIAFTHAGTGASACITFVGGTTGLSVDSCTFQLGTATLQNGRRGIYGHFSSFFNDAPITNIAIRNCRFTGGQYGIYLNLYQAQGLLIEGNRCEQQSGIGISITGELTGQGISAIIQNNYCRQTGSDLQHNGSGFGIGIGMNGGNKGASTLVANNIVIHHVFQGLSVGGSNATVANNFILSQPEPGASESAISQSVMLTGKNIRFVHNTVRSYSPGACIQIFPGAEQITVRNNNLTRYYDVYGVMLKIRESNLPALVADHNNYYASCGINGTLFDLREGNSGNYTPFSAWQQDLHRDSSSISADPQFILPGDFHIQADSLAGAALPLADVTTDLDGDPRDPVAPDIGADEFVPSFLDAALTGFSKPSVPLIPGNGTVAVRLLNRTSIPVIATHLEWSVNGHPQPPVDWTGYLLKNQQTEVPLGSWNFIADSNYTLSAKLFTVNGIADANAANDTLRWEQLLTALAGTYTIGAYPADFRTPESAVRSLSRRGVRGGVCFFIKPGTYATHLDIGNIPGISADRTVSFTALAGSADSAVLVPKSAEPLLQLQNARHLRFIDLGFRGAPADAAILASLSGRCRDIGFRNCRFRAVQRGTATGIWLKDSSSVQGLDVGACQFENLAYGIQAFGADSLTGLSIEGNQFSAPTEGGIYMTGNWLSGAVSDNRIARSSFWTGTSTTLLLLQFTAAAVRVERNMLQGDASFGMQLSLANAGGPENTVANNFIYLEGGSSVGALHLGTCGNLLLAHNTVHIGQNPNSIPFALLTDILKGTIRIFNNIFRNDGAGLAGGFTDYKSVALIESDYNCWYTDNPTKMYVWTTEYATFKDYQTGTGKDVHAVFYRPEFDFPGDFHSGDPVLNGAGLPLIGITHDLDGEERDGKMPDIGADEFYIAGRSMPKQAREIPPSVVVTPTLVTDRLQIDAGDRQLEAIAIINANGRLERVVGASGQTQVVVYLAELAAGVYWVNIYMASGLQACKMIIKK